MPHVDEGQLHAYLDGELEAVQPGASAALEAHVAACPVCAARLEEARGLRAAASGILRAGPTHLQLRSFERLGGSATQPPRREVPNHRRALQRRATALAWAASLVVALGLGWLARDIQSSRDQALVLREMPALEAPATLARSAPAAPAAPAGEYAHQESSAAPLTDAAPAEAPETPGTGAVAAAAPAGAAVAGAPVTATPVTAAAAAPVPSPPVPVLAAAPAPTPLPQATRTAPPVASGDAGTTPDAPEPPRATAAAPEQVTIAEVTWHSRPLASEAVVNTGATAADSCALVTLPDRREADAILLTAVARAESSSTRRASAEYAVSATRMSGASAAAARVESPAAQLVELHQLGGPRAEEIERLLRDRSTRQAIVVPWEGASPCHPRPAHEPALEPGTPVRLKAWLRPAHSWISGRPTFDVLRAAPR